MKNTVHFVTYRKQIIDILGSCQTLQETEVIEAMKSATEYVLHVGVPNDAAPSRIFPAWFLWGKLVDCCEVTTFETTDDIEFSEWDQFLPPEYFTDGICCEQSIVWAIGMLGFKLFTGQLSPFGGKSLQLAIQNRLSVQCCTMKGVNPPPSNQFLRLIEVSLHQDLSIRYGSVSSLNHALESLT